MSNLNEYSIKQFALELI